MADIKKGSIVWYYDRTIKEWRRGKVFSVNRYYVMVNMRHGRGPAVYRYTEPVMPASLPKPNCTPEELRNRNWISQGGMWRYDRTTRKRYSLLQRFGITPKVLGR
jgi:hypothetical protein